LDHLDGQISHLAMMAAGSALASAVSRENRP